LNGIKLINNTTTVSSKQTTKIKVKRIINKENGQIKFEVLGTVSTRESQKKYYRSIPTVKNLPGAYIKAFFAENNIPIKGEVQDGLLPSHAKNLIRYQSKSLVEILKSTNTFSNNYMSDILVNHIGRTYQTNMREGSTESTFTTGIDELKQYMIKTLGIKSKFHINSGSGLTTENRISADQVIALLVHMASNYPLFNHFINTLPQVGHEGSFINRFDAKEYQAWKQGIYAKTGTLLHPITVSALAGYFYHPKHKFIAFAIIQNGRINNTQPQLGKLQKSQDLHLHKIYNSF
ncbi:MAG: hypothetical protein CMP11_06305, partial [Zetaproteobacteria bacterium]|nr:hypothetical protein [Pseudobdellovibrionaceae bacterium]